MDEIIAAYMAEIDVTLIDAPLRLTPQHRCGPFEQFMELCFELRRAGEAHATQRASAAGADATASALSKNGDGQSDPMQAGEG